MYLASRSQSHVSACRGPGTTAILCIESIRFARFVCTRVGATLWRTLRSAGTYYLYGSQHRASEQFQQGLCFARATADFDRTGDALDSSLDPARRPALRQAHALPDPRRALLTVG